MRIQCIRLYHVHPAAERADLLLTESGVIFQDCRVGRDQHGAPANVALHPQWNQVLEFQPGEWPAFQAAALAAIRRMDEQRRTPAARPLECSHTDEQGNRHYRPATK